MDSEVKVTFEFLVGRLVQAVSYKRSISAKISSRVLVVLVVGFLYF